MHVIGNFMIQWCWCIYVDVDRHRCRQNVEIDIDIDVITDVCLLRCWISRSIHTCTECVEAD